MNLKGCIQAAQISLVLGVTVLVFQFVATTMAINDARESALQSWAKANPGGHDSVSRYRELCEGKPAKEDIKGALERPITLAECLAQVGNPKLAEVMLHAADEIVAPAPLRWL